MEVKKEFKWIHPKDNTISPRLRADLSSVERYLIIFEEMGKWGWTFILQDHGGLYFSREIY